MSITKVTDAGLDRSRIVTPLIINGDMSIAQRGTSETGVGTAQVFVTDRFRNQPVYGSTAPTARFTITQSTTVPTGQGFFNSLKWDCTTAQGSLTSDTGFTIEQRLEGQNVQSIKKGTSNSEKLTMAFWVRSNKTGTYICELVDNDNTRHCSKSYTISSADTWEKKIINFPADTTGAFGNDNALSLKLRIWLAAGSDFTGGTLATSFASVTNANTAVGQVNLADSTDNEFYLTGVQMEIGEFDTNTIPSFPFENFDSNLHKCQRYFYKLGGVANKYKRVGTCITNPNNRNQTAGFYYLPNSMRAEPTVTISGSSSGVYIGGEDSYSSFAGSMESANDSKNLSVLRFAGTLSGNAGNHCLENNLSYSGTGFMSADAEL